MSVIILWQFTVVKNYNKKKEELGNGGAWMFPNHSMKEV